MRMGAHGCGAGNAELVVAAANPAEVGGGLLQKSKVRELFEFLPLFPALLVRVCVGALCARPAAARARTPLTRGDVSRQLDSTAFSNRQSSMFTSRGRTSRGLALGGLMGLFPLCSFTSSV